MSAGVTKVARPCVTRHQKHPGPVHILVSACRIPNPDHQGPKESKPLCTIALQVSVCITCVNVSLVKQSQGQSHQSHQSLSHQREPQHQNPVDSDALIISYPFSLIHPFPPTPLSLSTNMVEHTLF